MKFNFTKEQWMQIGNKAGWLKTAQSKPAPTPPGKKQTAPPTPTTPGEKPTAVPVSPATQEYTRLRYVAPDPKGTPESRAIYMYLKIGDALGKGLSLPLNSQAMTSFVNRLAFSEFCYELSHVLERNEHESIQWKAGLTESQIRQGLKNAIDACFNDQSIGTAKTLLYFAHGYGVDIITEAEKDFLKKLIIDNPILATELIRRAEAGFIRSIPNALIRK